MRYWKTTLVVRILLGLIMCGAGALSLIGGLSLSDAPMPPSGNPAMDSLMAAIIATGWLLPWVGIFKVVTGILLFVRRTAPLATLMALPFFVNIFLFTIFTAPKLFVMGLIVLALNVWLVYAYGDKYRPILEE